MRYCTSYLNHLSRPCLRMQNERVDESPRVALIAYHPLRNVAPRAINARHSNLACHTLIKLACEIIEYNLRSINYQSRRVSTSLSTLTFVGIDIVNNVSIIKQARWRIEDGTETRALTSALSNAASNKSAKE